MAKWDGDHIPSGLDLAEILHLRFQRWSSNESRPDGSGTQDLANLASIDQLLHCPESSIEATLAANSGELDIVLLAQFEKLFSLLQILAEWPFHQDVFSSLDSWDGGFEVTIYAHSADDKIYIDVSGEF